MTGTVAVPHTLPVPASAPPAVRVDRSTPAPAPAAARMDVAAFVGRVKRKGVTAQGAPTLTDEPAAVESADAFADAFVEGDDSRLGPAVRAFFRNGGRRCWVVPADPPFVDARLDGVGLNALAREAVLLDTPPTGVHAVLALDEVTLLAVPDAFPPRTTPGATVTDAAPPSAPAPATPATDFSACKKVSPAVYNLTLTLTPKPAAPAKWVELTWDWVPTVPPPGETPEQQAARQQEEAALRGAARFVLERNPRAFFPPSDTVTVYRGPGKAVSVGIESAFYRVRADAPALVGAWSVPRQQSIPTGQPVGSNEDAVLTQVAAVRVCAARGDVLAVLTPPENWPRMTDTEWGAWTAANTRFGVPIAAPNGTWVELVRQSKRWLAPAEGAALARFAAFWGPWVLARDAERPVPPTVRPETRAPLDPAPEAFPADGAVCGLLARRALERGAWASVLGLPVVGVLGVGPTPYGQGDYVPLFAPEPPAAPPVPGVPLVPSVPPAPAVRDAVAALQARGVNVLARTARGFVPVGERTPPADPRWDAPNDPARALEVVPVRRFFALLRRELQRVGPSLAFLPNGPALERRSVRAVETVLEDLLRRGALVGPDSRSSFQVTARAGDSDSTAESQLVVEVRVRPALPLRLLTLKLVRVGEGAFTVVEGTP